MSHPSREQVINAAIKLAQDSSWEEMSLHSVAESMNVDLHDVFRHVMDKQEIVTAWFENADKSMMHAASLTSFKKLSIRDKLQVLILAWLKPLGENKKLTREMLIGNLGPSHIHEVVAAITRVQHTIHWLRDAAHCDAIHLIRTFEEAGLATIFLSTFLYWLHDDSDNLENTKRFLSDKLTKAEQARLLLPNIFPSFLTGGSNRKFH